jgi:DNA-binding XRE family transcriptional regulator
MPDLTATLARLVRDARIMLDVTQRGLAATVGVSRSEIAAIENGKANPSLRLVQRLADVLQLEVDFVSTFPAIVAPRQRDLVHAWCLSYVERRLRAAGYIVRREVEVVVGRSHGWIDLLAFQPSTGILILVELKTRLDDIGAIERQVGWYEREAIGIARRLGWRPIHSATWVVALASEEVDDAARLNREYLRSFLPARASTMRRVLADGAPSEQHRGFALIDPGSRRREWLIPGRIDGRRAAAPYLDYADAARRRTHAAR